MARASKTNVQTADGASAALPSITELGRMLGRVSRQEAAIDLLPVAKGAPANEEDRQARLAEELRRTTADTLLFSRLDALRDLVGTLPAATLSDCIVQLNVAAHWIMKLTCNDCDKAEVDELSDKIERVMISVMPVLAAAAGLGLIEYGLDEVINLHEGRFPELAA